MSARSSSDALPRVAKTAESPKRRPSATPEIQNLRPAQADPAAARDLPAEPSAELEQRVAERTAVAEQRAKQLRALAMQLTRTEQRERRRLARVLHDSLQQLLVGARLRVQRLRTADGHGDCPAAAGEIDDLLSEALAVSRSLMTDLYPSVLYNVGLAAALEWLGNHIMAAGDLAVVVEADEQASPGDDDLAALLFDATRELLLNVVKHAGATLVRVILRQAGENLIIEVRDNGAGFPPQAAADNQSTGTGLGLFSIRERLAMIGGRLEIDSTPGHGATVTLVAPVAATAPADPQAAPVPPPAPGEPPAVKGGPLTRVLLVDDHQVLLDGLDALLSDKDGLAVVGRATDGPSAIDLARSTQPDVVVMDINMPGMDGIEATRRILAAQPAVKVVGLSMRDEEGVAAKMREAGAAAYLSKDGLADALVDTLRDVAANRTAKRATKATKNAKEPTATACATEGTANLVWLCRCCSFRSVFVSFVAIPVVATETGADPDNIPGETRRGITTAPPWPTRSTGGTPAAGRPAGG